jgi:hypothetical protein
MLSFLRRSAGAALVSAALVGSMASAAGATPRAASTPTARDLQASRSVLFGVSLDVRHDAYRDCVRAAGRAPGLVNVYVSFASPNFDAGQANRVRSYGAIPMITWEPWDDGALGPDQPQFALRRFLAGDFDAYVRHWAEGARAWGHPVLLRFAPEMNGFWNSWSPGVVGNTAQQFVAMWRRVHAIFDDVGADNVEWVWSPNVAAGETTPLARVYPGDRYVDWVGLDGYNWGASRAGMRWQSFDSVFGRTLDEVRRLTSKPLMISEVGSTEVGGDKARWISSFFRALARNRDILAFVWFDFDKETDWRLDSSAAARSAFATGLAAPRYRSAPVAAAADAA